MRRYNFTFRAAIGQCCGTRKPGVHIVSFRRISVFCERGGGAFETFSASSGQDIRNVEFDMLREDLECLRQLLDLF